MGADVNVGPPEAGDPANRDRVPEVARWLVEEAAPTGDPWSDPQRIATAMHDRWPDLTPDEVNRAVDIATELKLVAIHAGETQS